MKKLNKPVLMAAVVSGATLVAVGTAAGVSAATSSSTDPQSSLVTKIADKFKLDKSQVQAVFDEERAAHQAERQQKLEDRLTQAVKDGKITEAQKAKIIAKAAELKASKDDLKNKTPEERRAAMDAKRTELEQWAKDNGIPTEYAFFGGGHGKGGHGFRGDRAADAQ